MVCEILAQARIQKNNPSLECGEICKIECECPLVEDNEAFPPKEVIVESEIPHVRNNILKLPESLQNRVLGV